MKIPATLIRYAKGPVLAALHVGDDVFYVVEVCCKGGHKYALGCRKRGGFNWVIKPTGKTELWQEMKKTWDINVSK